jgi:N-glycosylase/DNA lyase
LIDIDEIVKLIEKLKSSSVAGLVNNKIREFEEMHKKNSDEWFKELCFCILTANFNAEKSLKIFSEINDGFLTLSKIQLAKKLESLGHRFYQKRAEFIVEARKYRKNLKNMIKSFKNERKAREWLVKNVKGIGFKEASHFLRNVGYKNVSLIDRHILRILFENGLINNIPKSLTKRKYPKIEKKLEKIAKATNLNLAELDLYLWYSKTGKVLK